MSYLSNDTYLHDINIPGTHGSWTYDIGQMTNNDKNLYSTSKALVPHKGCLIEKISNQSRRFVKGCP